MGDEKDPLGLFSNTTATTTEEGPGDDPLGLFSVSKAVEQEEAPKGGGTQFPLTEALRKRFASTVVDQVPMALAQAGAGTERPETYDEFAKTHRLQGFPSRKQLKGLTKAEAIEEFGGAGSDWVKDHLRSLIGFPAPELTFKKILEKAHEIAGPNATEEQIHGALDQAYNTQVGNLKKTFLDYADVQKQEAAAKLSNVAQSSDQVTDVPSALSYVGGTIGQSAGLLPLTAALGPTGMIAMEKGEGYQTALDELQKANPGLTRNQILDQRLDKSAEHTSDVTGVINGALESAGDLAVLGKLIPVGKATNALTKIFKGSKIGSTILAMGGEGVTEALQQLDTQLGAKMAAGKTADEALSEIKLSDLKEDFLGGLIGGGGVHALTLGAGNTNPVAKVENSAIDEIDADGEQLLHSATTGDEFHDKSIDDLVAESSAYVDKIARESEALEGTKVEEELAAAQKKASDAVLAQRKAEQELFQVNKNAELATQPVVHPEHVAQEEALQAEIGAAPVAQEVAEQAPVEPIPVTKQVIQNDKENKARVQSSIQERKEEPVSTKPVESRGREKVERSRVLQEAPKHKEALDEAAIKYNRQIDVAIKAKPGRKLSSLQRIGNKATELGLTDVVTRVNKEIAAHETAVDNKVEAKELKEAKPVKTREEIKAEREVTKAERAKKAEQTLLGRNYSHKGHMLPIRSHRERLIQAIANESVKVTKEDKTKYESAIQEYKDFRKSVGLAEQSDDRIRELVQNESRQKTANRNKRSEALDRKRENYKAVRLSAEDDSAKQAAIKSIAEDIGIDPSELSDEDHLSFANGNSTDLDELRGHERHEITHEEYKALAPSAQHPIISALNRTVEKYKEKEGSKTRYFKYVVKKGAKVPRISGFQVSFAKNDNSALAAVVNEEGKSISQENGKNTVLHEYFHEYTKAMYHRVYAHNKSFRKEVSKVFDSTKKEVRSQLKDTISRLKDGKETTGAQDAILEFAMVQMQEASPNPIKSRDLFTNESSGEIADNIINSIYAFSDVDEFMAEALSDPHTAFFLSQVKTKEKITSGFNKGQDKSLLYKWYETLHKFVKNAFAYLPTPAASQFKSTLDTLLDVISEFDSEFVSGDLIRKADYDMFKGVAAQEKAFKDVSQINFKLTAAEQKKADKKIIKNLTSTLNQREEIKSLDDVQKYIDRVNKNLPVKHQLGTAYTTALYKSILKARKDRVSAEKFSKHFLEAARKRLEYIPDIAFHNLVEDFAAVNIKDLNIEEARVFAHATSKLALNGTITKKAYDIMINKGKVLKIVRVMSKVAPELKQTFSSKLPKLANNETFASIISHYNPKVSNTVSHAMYGGVMKAHTLTTNEGHAFSSDLTETADKLKLYHNDLARVGMVGGIFSTLADPTSSEYQTELNKNAEHLLSSAENKLIALNNKTYKGRLSKKAIESEIEIAKELEKKVKAGESIDKILSKEQKVIYDKVRKFADAHIDSFERNAVGIWENKKFTRRFNYFPTKAQGKVDSTSKDQSVIRDKGDNLFDAMDEENQNSNTIYAKKSMSQVDRVNPEGYYYEHDALSIAQPWSQNLLFDIYASGELRAINRVFKNPEFKKAINEKTRLAFIHQLRAAAGAGNKYDPEIGAATRVVLRAGNALYGAHLTTAGQFLTQLSSGVAGTAILSASLNPLTAANSMRRATTAAAKSMYPGSKYYKFIEENGNGIQHRNIQYERDLIAADFVESGATTSLNRGARKLRNTIESANSMPLTWGDKLAARMVFFASYFDQGGTIENPNKEAIIHAERKTGIMQNVSNINFSATALKYDNVYKRILMSMFYGFKSFALNNYINMVYSAPNLHKSKEARQVFTAALASVAASQALAALVLKPAYSALASAISPGDGEDDDDDKKKRFSKTEEIVTESVWNALIGGAAPQLVDGMLRMLFNQVTKPVYTPQFEQYDKYLDSPLYSAKKPEDLYKGALGAGTGEIATGALTGLDAYMNYADASDYLENGDEGKAENAKSQADADLQMLYGTILGMIPGIPAKGDIIKILRKHIQQEKARKSRAKANAKGSGSGEETDLQEQLFTPDSEGNSNFTDEEFNELNENQDQQ